MTWLQGFAAALGSAAIIGSIAESLVADTKLEKYVRLIVAFFLLLVIFSFVLRIDLNDFQLKTPAMEMQIPDGEAVARAGILSLSRVELGKQMEACLQEETGELFRIVTLHMKETGEGVQVEKAIVESLCGRDAQALSAFIEKKMGISLVIEEEIHE